MRRFILRRIFQGLITLFFVSIVIFLLGRLTGDPVQLLLPPEATQEDVEEIREVLGLDKPLPVQYYIFFSNALKGDLGKSIKFRQPVTGIILERLPNSVKLAVASIAITLLMGLPLGVMAAVKRGSALDALARTVAFLGQAMPTFWLGIVLIILFSLKLGWLPAMGIGGPAHYIMPAFVLGWHLAAGVLRLLRSGLLEVLDSEFVKMARLKGVPERAVIWKHALRNAIIPVITFTGMYFALLIGMAIIVETVFAWPGIGRLAYQSVLWRDFPLLQGVVMLIAIIVILMNLIVDVLYAYIDPRIRY